MTTTLPIPRLLALLALSSAIACDSGPGGQVGDLCSNPSFVCSTAACSQFPTTTGCTTVKPSGAYCPVDLYRCWDPTTGAGYCDPSVARCAKPKKPAVQCAVPLCALAQLTACSDTNDDLFCKDSFTCQSFTCGDDGGILDGSGAVDATSLNDQTMSGDF